MSVDLVDVGQNNAEVHSFLRFDFVEIPGPLHQLRLVLTTTSDPNAGSPDSTGELWQVNPFDYTTLETLGGPLNVGLNPIGANQGAIGSSAPVEWLLPPAGDIVVEGAAYFAVRPTSTDGVMYWAHNGSHPPQLFMDCP